MDEYNSPKVSPNVSKKLHVKHTTSYFYKQLQISLQIFIVI